MINYRLIGQRIGELRRARKISQASLAEMVDLSVPYISYLESAQRKPSLETLMNISNALGVTLDELLCGNQLYNPTDYQTDLDLLMNQCSSNERRFIFEMVRSSVEILRKNKWQI